MHGLSSWMTGTKFGVFDMRTWDKRRIGMGYHIRRTSEHLVMLQKQPRRAKRVSKVHNISDVWQDDVKKNGHGGIDVTREPTLFANPLFLFDSPIPESYKFKFTGYDDHGSIFEESKNHNAFRQNRNLSFNSNCLER